MALKVSTGKRQDMAENPDSKDKSLEAVDFIINVLKQHEQNLDKSIDHLATVAEQLGNTDALNGKMETVEEKINSLQKEVTNLITYVSGCTPKEALPATIKEHTDQTAPLPAIEKYAFSDFAV